MQNSGSVEVSGRADMYCHSL